MKRRTSVSPKKNMENGWLILIFKKTFHLLYEHCEKAELQYSNILREMTFAKKKNFAHKFYATEAKFSVPQKFCERTPRSRYCLFTRSHILSK